MSFPRYGMNFPVPSMKANKKKMKSYQSKAIRVYYINCDIDTRQLVFWDRHLLKLLPKFGATYIVYF